MRSEHGYILGDDHISIFFGGDDPASISLYKGQTNYEEVRQALKTEPRDWAQIRALADPTTPVKEAIKPISELVRIEDGVVWYDDKPLENTLTQRMLRMVNEGHDVRPLGMFLENLMENPSYRAVQELFTFLDYGNLPITEDGHFLAYKKIRQDWTDCHSGRIDNSIGAIVKMPRNEVDDNCNHTCSAGLHFCSREYLRSFGGARLVSIKINPRDVVSIPVDYNNTKGRCCRYEVVAEIEQGRRLEDSSYMPTSNLTGYISLAEVDVMDDLKLLDLADLPTEFEGNEPGILDEGWYVGDVGPFKTALDADHAKTRARELLGWNFEVQDDVVVDNNGNEFFVPVDDNGIRMDIDFDLEGFLKEVDDE